MCFSYFKMSDSSYCDLIDYEPIDLEQFKLECPVIRENLVDRSCEQALADLRLIYTEERIQNQGDILKLTGELDLVKFQLNTSQEALTALQNRIKYTEDLLQDERQQVDNLKEEITSIKSKYLAECNTHSLIKERDALQIALDQAKAEAIAAKQIINSDGNTLLLLSTLQNREAEIIQVHRELKKRDLETSKLVDQIDSLTKAKNELQADLKSLLNSRTQLQALKAQLLASQDSPKALQYEN